MLFKKVAQRIFFVELLGLESCTDLHSSLCSVFTSCEKKAFSCQIMLCYKENTLGMGSKLGKPPTKKNECTESIGQHRSSFTLGLLEA